MSAQFGLSSDVISKIHSILNKHPIIEKAIIYGSRAKGNYKPGSDIDLTFFGDKISFKELGAIDDELDDLLLPYTFDLSDYQALKNDQLREHIESIGKIFYKKTADEKNSII